MSKLAIGKLASLGILATAAASGAIRFPHRIPTNSGRTTKQDDAFREQCRAYHAETRKRLWWTRVTLAEVHRRREAKLAKLALASLQTAI